MEPDWLTLHHSCIAKQVDSDGAGTGGYVTTAYAYDGAHIALQFDNDAKLTNRYLHGPAIDQLLADEQVDWDSSGAQYVVDDLLWALSDNLGTVRDLAKYDSSTNTAPVVNHRTFDAFGSLLSEIDPATNATASLTTSFAFTGRELDIETGLYYYRARYYDPVTGRFLSEDPIADDEQNSYRYVGNGPTNATDPSGLAWYQFSVFGKPYTLNPRDADWNPFNSLLVMPGRQILGEAGSLLTTGSTIPIDSANDVVDEAFFATGRSAKNSGVGAAKGVRELGYMAADNANGVVYVTTGWEMCRGNLSQAADALNSGQSSVGRYYGEFTANTATFGAYGQVKATYQYTQGEISEQDFSEQVGGTALLQGIGARGMARTRTSVVQSPARRPMQAIPDSPGFRSVADTGIDLTTIGRDRQLMVRPIEIEFPATGLTAAERASFAAHLAEQEMTLNRMSRSAKADLELNLLNYQNIDKQVNRSRILARKYLPGDGEGLNAAHALDAVAGGYPNEFAGFRSPIQQLIGSLWRTRASKIEPGIEHRLNPKFSEAK